MVSGFNVNIKHAGKVFHVQTEDRGRRNPTIETLVYLEGKIIHQERISYEGQNSDESYDEAAIAKMVDLQHKRMIDGIRGGRFDVEEERRPFGEEFITKGKLRTKYIAPIYEDQVVISCAKVTAIDGNAYKLEVWCEDDTAKKLTVGEATAYARA